MHDCDVPKRDQEVKGAENESIEYCQLENANHKSHEL